MLLWRNTLNVIMEKHAKCYYGETHLMLLWRNTLNVIMEKHTKCYYGETH